MPHYKCVACRTRLQVWGSSTELVKDLCPECGSHLEPVAELGELVGLRSIQSGDRANDAAGTRLAPTSSLRVERRFSSESASTWNTCAVTMLSLVPRPSSRPHRRRTNE
jgi:hypothetical protein